MQRSSFSLHRSLETHQAFGRAHGAFSLGIDDGALAAAVASPIPSSSSSSPEVEEFDTGGSKGVRIVPYGHGEDLTR